MAKEKISRDINTVKHQKIRIFRLSPRITIEHFGNRSLVFLGAEEAFLTVNKPAATLLELIHIRLKMRQFVEDDLAKLLKRYYTLTSEQAVKEAENILENWCKCGILINQAGIPHE